MASEGMKAMVLEAPGVAGLRLRRRPIPEPDEGQVLVRIRACGVGGTVLRKVRGLRQDQLPRVPGHEITGEIAAVGPGVADLGAGDRILVYTYVTCGRCSECWRDRASLCKQTPNRAAWEKGEHWDAGFRIGEDSDGGFAEYVVIPQLNAIPLPAGVGFLEATTAVDALATSLRVLRRAGVVAGERVLVIGAAGGLGVHLIQVARWMGAEPIAIDLPEKLEPLDRYGATELIDANDSQWHEALRASVDVTVDFVGRPSTLTAGLGALTDRGRLVVLTPDVGVEFPVPTRAMVAGERVIIGSKSHSRADVQEGANLLINGDVVPVVSSTVSLEEVPGLLRELEANSLFARGAIDLG